MRNPYMTKPIFRIAGCQFSVEADIQKNLSAILAQIRDAAKQGARIAHFSETALSGYAGCDIPDSESIDWELLQASTEAVCQAAADHNIWVLLGSTHRLSEENLPHNSVYVINDQGTIVERYDKRFCTGTLKPETNLDLLYYSPGNHATVFDLDGYLCGVLICYDYRFPELYRDLKTRGVEVLFQSFHNARREKKSHLENNIWKEIVPATMMCRAATNHIWISVTNSATRYSSWANFFVRADGQITGRLELHEPSILISEVDPELEIWDAPGPWRERSIRGQLHSGNLADDPRSKDKTCL